MACDADHVALYVGAGGKWTQVAGPFLKSDRDNQAAAIVGHLSKKMNAEQEAKLQKAYQKRGRYHDPFLFVGLSEMLLHGIEHPLLRD